MHWRGIIQSTKREFGAPKNLGIVKGAALDVPSGFGGLHAGTDETHIPTLL